MSKERGLVEHLLEPAMYLCLGLGIRYKQFHSNFLVWLLEILILYELE